MRCVGPAVERRSGPAAAAAHAPRPIGPPRHTKGDGARPYDSRGKERRRTVPAGDGPQAPRPTLGCGQLRVCGRSGQHRFLNAVRKSVLVTGVGDPTGAEVVARVAEEPIGSGWCVERVGPARLDCAEPAPEAPTLSPRLRQRNDQPRSRGTGPANRSAPDGACWTPQRPCPPTAVHRFRATAPYSDTSASLSSTASSGRHWWASTSPGSRTSSPSRKRAISACERVRAEVPLLR